MVQIIEGDLMNVKEGTIFHQVNCKGVMGAGLAKQIRERHPVLYQQYKIICDYNNYSSSLLGCWFTFKATPELIIISIFGQHSYGRSGKYTDYDSLKIAFRNIREKIDSGVIKEPLCFPEGFGCGLAGGSWNIVSKLICEAFQDCDVRIYRYGKH